MFHICNHTSTNHIYQILTTYPHLYLHTPSIIRFAHKPDDHWCEASLDLSDMFRTALAKGSAVSFETPYNGSVSADRHVSAAGPCVKGYQAYDSAPSERTEGSNKLRKTRLQDPFIAKLYHENFDYGQGELLVSMEIVPQTEAMIRPAGQGRSAPNNKSVGFVPAPPGRTIAEQNNGLGTNGRSK